MKVTEHIKNAKEKTLFSFEIVPPQKGQNIQKLYDNIDPLMEFKPPFIDVTTSREEHVYIKKEGGLLERKVTRMRPGTVGICASLMNKYQGRYRTPCFVRRFYERRNRICVGRLSLFGN